MIYSKNRNHILGELLKYIMQFLITAQENNIFFHVF